MRGITINPGILAVLCCFCIGCFFSQAASKSSGSVSFFSEGVTELQLAGMLEKEDGEDTESLPRMAAYADSGMGQVENRQNSIAAQACGYEVWGHMGEVFNRPLSYGSYGFFNQNEGLCIISRGLARVLFQSENVVGLTLLYQGREWKIQGVMELERALILIPGGEKSSYRRVNLNYQEEKEGRSLGEAMLTRHQIPYQDLVVDYGFFISLLHLLQTAHLWWFTMLMCLALYRHIQIPLIKLAAAFLMPLLLLVLGGKAFTFSASLIPGMWSDFAFWSERLREIKVLLAGIEGMKMSVRDIEFFRSVNIAAAAYLASLGILIDQSRFICRMFDRCFGAGRERLSKVVKNHFA